MLRTYDLVLRAVSLVEGVVIRRSSGVSRLARHVAPVSATTPGKMAAAHRATAPVERDRRDLEVLKNALSDLQAGTHPEDGRKPVMNGANK